MQDKKLKLIQDQLSEIEVEILNAYLLNELSILKKTFKFDNLYLFLTIKSDSNNSLDNPKYLGDKILSSLRKDYDLGFLAAVNPQTYFFDRDMVKTVKGNKIVGMESAASYFLDFFENINQLPNRFYFIDENKKLILGLGDFNKKEHKYIQFYNLFNKEKILF